MYWRPVHCFCTIFCLLLILNACGQSAGNGVAASSTSTPTSAPIGTGTGAVGAMQACPAPAIARSAFMPSITLGTHATIVYLAQQGSNSSILRRYDVTTGETQILLQTHTTETIRTASISPDGQWVLLLSLLQGQQDQTAIQLVRIDGQHLQTLYCAPAQTSIDQALLSPDQHFLMFNQVDQNYKSILYLLDMTTGKLHTELSPWQPNYPGVLAQELQEPVTGTPFLLSSTLHGNDSTTGNLAAQRLNPLPSKHYPIYLPMKWAGNSVFLLGTFTGSPTPPPQFALLRDIHKDATQQQSNVQPIPIAAPAGTNCFTIDVIPDNRQVVCSAYTLLGPVSPTAIAIQPIAGGTPHVVYSEPAGGEITARVLSNSSIIFILAKPTSPPELWKINTSGSGLTRLITAPTTNVVLGFAYPGYLPSSITSRDGTLYALEVSSITDSTQSLLFGSLNGGTPKTFASGTNSLQIVGWTAYA